MRKRPKLTEYRFDQFAEELKSWIRDSVSPFENDTVEKQTERKERARHDQLYFFETYLPHYFSVEFGDFHEEWEELTELRDQAVFVAAPREHAKSTYHTFGVPIHDICFALRWFIIIVSDTNDQAVGFTLPIRLELEENPRLRHDFGEFRGRTWTRGDFTTANGVRVLARGRGEKVRGLKNRQYRPDRAVVDDFENDENVENPTLVKKGIQWLRRAVIGSMGQGFTFMMVGNLFHPKSVLAQFIAEKDDDGTPLYVSKIYRAILDKDTPSERPLWPALWSLERLEQKRRQMGTRDFNAEMMNLTGAEDSPFKEEWFVYYDRDTINLSDYDVVVSFIDPSAKSGENNDFKACITAGLNRRKMIVDVLHAWIRHASISSMFSAADNQYNEYHSQQIGIEENMFEEFLHEAITNHARKTRRYLPWKPVRHSTNKEARIVGTLQYLVEYGKLRFCKGHSDQDRVVEQLIYLLNKNINDDGADALEGAVSMIWGGVGDPVILTGGPREMAKTMGAY